MFENLFSSQFMPHGHCYLWTPGILWSLVISDAIIALSYFSIPIALTVFIRKRRDLVFPGTFKLFAIFILSCGVGHSIDIWNVWHADYWLTAFIRIITAIASFLTAIVLWPLIPRALRIPSTEMLTEQVRQKEKVELELAEANKTLEQRVIERTQELEEQKNTLKRSHDIMLDREHQMIQLKSEVNQLCEELGLPVRYRILNEESTS